MTGRTLTDAEIIARALCCVDPSDCAAEHGALPVCFAGRYAPVAADAVKALCERHRLIRCGGAAADEEMAGYG